MVSQAGFEPATFPLGGIKSTQQYQSYPNKISTLTCGCVSQNTLILYLLLVRRWYGHESQDNSKTTE